MTFVQNVNFVGACTVKGAAVGCAFAACFITGDFYFAFAEVEVARRRNQTASYESTLRKKYYEDLLQNHSLERVQSDNFALMSVSILTGAGVGFLYGITELFGQAMADLQ